VNGDRRSQVTGVLAPRTDASGRVVINGKGHAANLDVITAKYRSRTSIRSCRT